MKQIPINQNVLSLVEFNQKLGRLMVDGKAKTTGHYNSRFAYDLEGKVLGGVVWRTEKVWEYGQYVSVEKPYGYLHS